MEINFLTPTAFRSSSRTHVLCYNNISQDPTVVAEGPHKDPSRKFISVENRHVQTNWTRNRQVFKRHAQVRLKAQQVCMFQTQSPA